MASPCAACAQNPDVKAKPGIFPCLGCNQMFCTQHVAFHRQELSTKLDLVISDRNELQETIDRQGNMIDLSSQMNLIDEWEKKSVDQIHQVANNVRQQITSLAEEQKIRFNDQFAQLSKQLDSFREDENFYEQDIERLKEGCVNLKRLLNMSDVNIIVIKDVSSFLEKAVTVQQKEEKQAVVNLSFVEDLVTKQKPLKRVRIPHEGSVYVLNDLILIPTQNNFTLINHQTNSLQSVRIENHQPLLICPSTHLNGFLCTTANNSKIQLLKIVERRPKMVEAFDSVINGIRCIVCLNDQMMVVCRGLKDFDCVQEWSLKS